MGDKYSFKFIEDLIFSIDDNVAVRCTGASFIPYGMVPLTFWMFERQLTGNNCFYYHAPRSDVVTRKYASDSEKSEFTWAKRYILPELLKLPVATSEEFNNIATKTGLRYFNDLNVTEIVLDNKRALMRRESSKSYVTQTFGVEDIVNINKTYRRDLLRTTDTRQNVFELGIYDLIAELVNWEILRKKSI